MAWTPQLARAIGGMFRRLAPQRRPTFGERYEANMGRIMRRIEADKLADMEAKGQTLWRPDPDRVRRAEERC